MLPPPPPLPLNPLATSARARPQTEVLGKTPFLGHNFYGHYFARVSCELRNVIEIYLPFSL